jgi:hypothetical protein
MEYLEAGNRETHSRWDIVVADVAESDSTVSDDISEQRVPVRSHPNALRRSIAATPSGPSIGSAIGNIIPKAILCIDSIFTPSQIRAGQNCMSPDTYDG